MSPAVSTPWFRHAGGAMLRAAALPVHAAPSRWPTLTNPDSCRMWLGEVWDLPGFAAATRYASGSFADLVDAVLTGQIAEGRQVRRVTVSVLRYLLRCVGRPTPFGLFAGVAPVTVGGDPAVIWGAGHRATVRADTLWLDDVIERLETDPAVLAGLEVVASDLIVDRGERIEMPRGPGRVTVRNTAVSRLVRDAAATPITFAALADKLAEAFPAVSAGTISSALAGLVAEGVLITSLRAPMTVTDPLAYLIEALDHTASGTAEPVGTMTEALRDIRRFLAGHNAVDTGPDEQARLRSAAISQMRGLSTAGRATLAGDLHLDVQVTVPDSLADEVAYTAGALLRLTRQPRPDQRWNDWCREFWDRYGTGAVVPVTEATHPDAGLGLPAGFPASMYAEPDDTVSHRDAELLRLAWDAAVSEAAEIVLTDETIAAITADTSVDPRWIPPHVELGARVHAASVAAVRAGEYTFTVHPAQAFGTLTSRFTDTAASAGLDAVYAATPASVEGGLSVQLSFPPLFPHSENVARIPAHLPYVLPLGEHRRPDDISTVISLDDVGIVAVADGLHLVSISRRRVIEPQVFHALALAKQAPPLARFLATLTRGFLARYMEFDWGPAAHRLTYLPRVRYRKAVLAPATWRLTAANHAAFTADPAGWDDAFAAWRHRWHCPDTVELHDDHRSLRLTLTAAAHLTLLQEHIDKHGHATLTEADPASGTRWIGGHIHEIVMPFTRAVPPAPNLVSGPLPLAGNTAAAHVPAAPMSKWLYAQVFTHPERIDDILRIHLPHLLADLDGDPLWWFARYRSERETDHLRLRIRTTDPDAYAAVAVAVGRWVQRLCEAGAASRLALGTYRPEIGRYGPGPAMDAAEAVFAADSCAVALALRLLSAQVIDPVAVAAIGMVDITDGFHSDRQAAASWLVDRLAGKVAVSANRTVADQVAAWASHGTLPGEVELPAELAAAWQFRRAALTRYREALPGDADLARVLSALLHMHHNRARLIDRADEATCLRLARQVALARRARMVRSTP